LQIPLNFNAFEDFISWKGNWSGVFSMISAYHIEWRHQYNGQTCRDLVQGIALDNPIWKTRWYPARCGGILSTIFLLTIN
jgi:hypothetical protein